MTKQRVFSTYYSIKQNYNDNNNDNTNSRDKDRTSQRVDEFSESQQPSPEATSGANALNFSSWRPAVVVKSGSCSLDHAGTHLLTQAGAMERVLNHDK